MWGPFSGVNQNTSAVVIAVDVSAPLYERAYINRSDAGNNVLELGFDSTVTSPSTNYELGFTVECRIATGQWKTLPATTYVGTLNSSFIVFTFNSGTVKTFQGSHEIRVSYDQTVGDIVDDFENALASFTNVATLTNASTVDLLTGIVDVWHMSDESAAISAANDMTNNNSVVADALLDSGMQMSRTGPKYLSHADSAVFNQGDTNFTWSFWVKFDSIDEWQYMISKYAWTGYGEYLFRIHNPSNKPQFQLAISESIKRAEWGSAMAADTWYHMVGYYDTDNDLVAITVNAGTPVETTGVTGAVDDKSMAIAFGAPNDGNAAGAVEGIMDEIALHSKVLSSAEITDLYNSGTGKAYPYIPDPAVLYSSGEIGVVGSETVEIAFTENVDTDSDYTTGVTIKVGAVTSTIDSGTRQTDKSKVRYVLGAGVDGTEAVTWEYLDSSGGIKSDLGIQLGDVSAQEATNTAFEPEDLAGTVHWWHVRPSFRNGVTEGDGVAVSTWTEDAGVETFVQATGADQPTLQTDVINGMSVLHFAGDTDYMTSDLILSDIFAAGAKTAWFVVKIHTMGPSAAWYLSDTILTDQGGYWGAAVDSDEIVQGNFDTTSTNFTAASSASIDTVYVVEMRHEAAATLQTGLVAYYDFDDAIDSTGNWNLTEVNTPTYSSSSSAVVGKTGSYTQIESDTSQYLTNASFDSLHGATTATWMFFIKPESSIGYAGVAGEWDANNATSNWLVSTRGTGLKIGLFAGGDAAGGSYAYSETTSNCLTVDTWTHVRITLDTTQSTTAEQCKIYIDGTLITATTDSADANRFITLPSNTGLTLTIGGYEYATWTYTMDGDVDEFGLWNRIVTDAEAELHRLGTGPYTQYIYTSLNGGSEASTSTVNTHTMSNALKIGGNYATPPSVFFDGDIAEIITSNQAESSANRTAMRDVLENIYGLGLPASLSLTFFLEADRGVTTATGASHWVDTRFGGTVDLEQATGTKQPSVVASLFGDRSGLRFDGTDDSLSDTVSAMNIDTDEDLYLVLAFHTPSGWTGAGENFLSCLEGTPNTGWAIYCLDSKIRVNMANNFISGASLQVDGSMVLSADTDYIVEIIYNGQTTPVPANIDIFINGNEMNTYATISNGLGSSSIKGTGNLDIACQESDTGATTFMDIDYACIGASPTIPSDSDRNSLREYISNNYDIFYPSRISGLQQFVEMDRGVEESDVSIPENTENIVAWRDNGTGSDRDFSHATSSNQPIYNTSHFNLAGAVFDGSDDHLQAGNVSAMNFERTDDFYLIVAFKTPASFGTGFQVLYSKQINSGGYAGWLLHNVDKTCRMQMRLDASNDVNVAGGTALSDDTFYIVEMKYTGASTPTASNIEIFLNGSTESLTDNSVGTVNGTTQSIGEVMLGARGISGTSTTGYSTVIMAAAGCYDELPTDAERALLRNYLSNKYGG